MATVTSNEDPFPLMRLPRELHLVILNHLLFYDTFALRLTSRYFASIITPLKSPFAVFTHLRDATPLEYHERVYEDYNASWFARTSPKITTDPTPFPIMKLPRELHLVILDHLAFYDAFALRLTSRHFAAITQPLGRPYNLFEQLAEATPLDRRKKMYEEFNNSWFAKVESMVEVSCWLCGEGEYDIFDNRPDA